MCVLPPSAAHVAAKPSRPVIRWRFQCNRARASAPLRDLESNRQAATRRVARRQNTHHVACVPWREAFSLQFSQDII